MTAPSRLVLQQMLAAYWQQEATCAPLERDYTQVPEHILTGGLSPHHPCVAQIMSWAATRSATRVEDRAYSLMGLLGVNMHVVWRGKEDLSRLQLELIHTSNDQTIFAWVGLDMSGLAVSSPTPLASSGTVLVLSWWSMMTS